MKPFWTKTPTFIQKLFFNYLWKIKNNENKIYLTFDDGPIPNVTEWVLDLLKKENIKATFFCIGENIKKHPEIFKKIVIDGHAIGNHTFNHLNGWKANTNKYIENFELCEKEMEVGSGKLEDENTKLETEHLKLNTEHLIPNTIHSKLFRPPYGKIKYSQAKKIRKKGYKIIMWDVLSYDFDATVSPENCYTNVIKNVSSGSIIVFHDSLKAAKNMKYALPMAIQKLKEKGFVFDKIN
ncbi:MAG: polysaccharide deacetylase family protein [Flavobacterium sp.]|nr:polysaccharide deacetylase family protein [Flavobacterium sp.]